MFKQVSTYGALLLTTLIVIRAATKIEEGDVSSLYQRHADESFVQSNFDLLTSHSITVKRLEKKSSSNIAVLSMHKNNVPSIQKKERPFETKAVVNKVALRNDSIDLIASDPDVSEGYAMALDKENTINSNLSLLFPRQQIQPRSNRSTVKSQ